VNRSRQWARWRVGKCIRLWRENNLKAKCTKQFRDLCWYRKVP
jgi:hypothetical protein